MADPKPLSTAELADVGEWHTPGHRVTPTGVEWYCTGYVAAVPCDGTWPCREARWAATVDEQAIEVRFLKGKLRLTTHDLDRLRAFIESGRRQHKPMCESRPQWWVEKAGRQRCSICRAPWEPNHPPHSCSCGAAEHNAAIDAALGGGR